MSASHSKIKKLAGQILRDPFEINIAISKPASGVKQGAFLIYEKDKLTLIKSLIRSNERFQRILVFSSTKKKVRDIANELKNPDYNVEAISSDLEQSERKEVVSRFKGNQIRVLVATDVMSRGIDIKDIDLVINYDVPKDAEDYVHRIGRTARAKAQGVALTFINERETMEFMNIEKLIENEVVKIPLPEKLGKGPEYKVNARSQYRKKYSGKSRGKRK